MGLSGLKDSGRQQQKYLESHGLRAGVPLHPGPSPNRHGGDAKPYGAGGAELNLLEERRVLSGSFGERLNSFLDRTWGRYVIK